MAAQKGQNKIQIKFFKEIFYVRAEKKHPNKTVVFLSRGWSFQIVGGKQASKQANKFIKQSSKNVLQQKCWYNILGI